MIIDNCKFWKVSSDGINRKRDQQTSEPCKHTENILAIRSTDLLSYAISTDECCNYNFFTLMYINSMY